MSDQVTPIIQADPNELEATPDQPRDLGESTPPLPEPDPEIAVTEARDRVVRNFELAQDLRSKVVSLGLIDGNAADEYQLPEVAEKSQPKAREVVEKWEEVKQKLDSADETDQERKQLEQQQADLAMEFAYNTTGLLYFCYQTKLNEKIDAIRDSFADPAQSAAQTIELATQAGKDIAAMGGLSTTLEAFYKNVSRVVPDMIKSFPELSSRAYNLNQAVRIEIGMSRENAPNLNAAQDADLGNLLNILSSRVKLERLDDIKQKIEQFIASLQNQVPIQPVTPTPAAESSPTLNEFSGATDAAVATMAQPPTLESMLENLDVPGGSANPPEEPSQPPSLDKLLADVNLDSVPQSPEPATQTE